MQPAPEASPQQSKESPFKDVPKKMGELLLLALPTAVVGKIVMLLIERFATQPWQILWILVPLTGAVWIIWKKLRERQQFSPGKSLLTFLSIYILLFSIAGATDLLSWQRLPIGYEGAVPRNFLSLNWAGDWRYWLVRKKPANTDMLIVTMEPDQAQVDGHFEIARFDIARLIKLAEINGAKGIAFDFYFKSNSADKGPDDFLCRQIEDAKAKNVPVLVGYSFQTKSGILARDEIAPNLKSCLPDSNQGHLIGYAEWDGVIRMIPLYFKGDRSNEALKALSLRVASLLERKDIAGPENGLVQFVEAQKDLPQISYSDLIKSPELRGLLRDQFILVGEQSEKDRFWTPFGEKPGVLIHALAVHSLRQNHFIQRLSWWSGFSMVLVLCYLITVLSARGISNRTLVGINLLLSLLLFAFSAVAIYASLIWIDIIYPLTAIWLLLFLLMGVRRIKRMPISEGLSKPILK